MPAALFVSGAGPDADGDLERDQRSSQEWVRAVISYLEFRGGIRWRGGRSQNRNAARYLEYLDAIRLVESLQYQTEEINPQPQLPRIDAVGLSERAPWGQRPWDHFARCRCPRCRSLRNRGVDPASLRPAPGEAVLA